MTCPYLIWGHRVDIRKVTGNRKHKTETYRKKLGEAYLIRPKLDELKAKEEEEEY